MRRQVVLPQPEGPSSTQNVPDATSSETPFRAATLPQRRETLARRTAAPAPRSGLISMFMSSPSIAAAFA